MPTRAYQKRRLLELGKSSRSDKLGSNLTELTGGMSLTFSFQNPSARQMPVQGDAKALALESIKSGSLVPGS